MCLINFYLRDQRSTNNFDLVPELFLIIINSLNTIEIKSPEDTNKEAPIELNNTINEYSPALFNLTVCKSVFWGKDFKLFKSNCVLEIEGLDYNVIFYFN